ncbi:MAG: alpha-mannosidase [Clostridia bacterium]|nr:alpha-mannosidase [Clostridia bacterium]
MKELHMICNAHLDPVWLWRRPEGIAEAISTFRVAADFCEEFEGFIFNHNESVLYEWVEENEPELFERIQRLVKEGKWHIMGGWYLQPDCTMPSGESFIRQIETGNRYFKEKFGVKPTTAINFDPFGHTRGLVQILKKCGYDSYVFMRPGGHEWDADFIWKGFDGSEIIGHKTQGGYNSARGKILEKIGRALEWEYGNGINLMLWGVGNHGGGPSRVDLETIEKYKKENPGFEVIHSTCEDYFKKIDKSNLPKINKSLVHCMVGCYTTMVRIKQANRHLENDLAMCEKMLCVSGVDYDKSELEKAEKALLFCQFHDVLPGTLIKGAEDDCLRLFSFGEEIVDKYKTKAFLKLCEGQPKAKDGEIPVLVFNPNPYPVKENIEVEFQLADQNWNDNETTVISVRDENGNYLPTQNEKESSSLNLDWRKRICFTAELKPMSINRFDCELEVKNLPKREIRNCEETDTHFVFKNDSIEVKINKSTGLIDTYKSKDMDYLKEGSAKIRAYRDNEDPWGMETDGFYDCIGEFTLASDDEANRFNGYPDEKISNIRVIEYGDVRCKIQAIFKYSNSFAVVTYTLPNEGSYVDIKIKMLSADSNVFYKLSFDTEFCSPIFAGQTAFGKEGLMKAEHEVTYQKWCGAFEHGYGFAVINNGTYGGSATDGKLNISLMRTPVYSAHPIRDRQLTDHDRNHDHIDLGEREFEYRITTKIDHLDKDAEIFNQRPMALSFFPSGDKEKKETEVSVDNEDIILTRLSNRNNGVTLRLYNSSQNENTANVKISGTATKIDFTPFEVKTFKINGSVLNECGMLD